MGKRNGTDVDVDTDTSHTSSHHRSPLPGNGHATDSAETRDRIDAARVNTANTTPNTDTTTTPDTDTTTPPPDRTDDDGDGDERQPLPRDEDGRPIIERDENNKHDPDDLRELYEDRDPETGRIPEDKLPEKWGYDSNGTLHDENGWKVAHPDERNQSLRTKYYPDGFSPETHQKMIQTYTVEGRKSEGETGTIPAAQVPDGKQPADGWKTAPPIDYEVRDGVPVDTSTGKPVPRERLTWSSDAEGNNPVPYYRENSNGQVVTNLQYDHNTPAAQHWHEHGHDMPYDKRAEWFDNPENLTPMGAKENAGKGAESSSGERYTYSKTPGDNYTAKPGR
ncbi:hypothetical protein AB0K52_20390 [Glycomyces sp. NPDC049804]|uniref:hypothetical protein n=1 Tax=Glycomyces sp. NPDC049804 TaxID=3154363 RepID=UPI00343C0A5B